MTDHSREKGQATERNISSPEESTSPQGTAAPVSQGGIFAGAGAFGILDTLGSDEEGGSGSGGDEHNFSDDEGFIEEILDSEIMARLRELHGAELADRIMSHHKLETPQVDTDLDMIVVVNNIPKINSNESRMDRLENILRKILSKSGKIVNIHFAKDSAGMLKGYMLVEYKSPESAEKARELADGYEMDKSHTFQAFLLPDVLEALEINGEYKEEPVQDYPGEGKGPLWWWIMEEDAHDQYAVLHQGSNDDLSIPNTYLSMWWNTGFVPRFIMERVKWTMPGFIWSKKGTFLVTVHPQGAVVWAFETFERFLKYQHSGVKLVDISPGENFIVTCSLPQTENEENVKIWDLSTAKVIKMFSVDLGILYPDGRDKPAKWPLFQWSYNDEYFGILSQVTHSIRVFRSDTMKLLDEKAIYIPNIKDFSWRPRGSTVLAYWFPEQNQKPAQVALLNIPSRNVVRQKNLVGVHDCELKWSENGKHLLCKVLHYVNKSRKQNKTKTAFEVFSLGQDKEIPVISIDAGENVITYAMELNGNKIAAICNEPTKDSIGHTTVLKFFSVDPSRGSNPFLKEMSGIHASHLSWSPLGQYLLAAAITQNTGDLIFIDTADFSVIQRQSHPSFTDLQWDPTGRYLCTFVDYMSRRTECSYNLWTFYGRCYYKATIPFLYAFRWRRRPPTVLSEEKQQEIQKNISQYQKVFEQKDKQAQRNEQVKLHKKHREMYEVFMRVKSNVRERMQELATKLNRCLEYVQDEEYYDVETVERFDSEKVEIVK